VTVGRKKKRDWSLFTDPYETETVLEEEDEELQRLLNSHGAEHLDYVFWDVVLCSFEDRYQHFRGT
jgi:hypothetical protein